MFYIWEPVKEKGRLPQGGLTASNFTIVARHASGGPITILPAEKLNVWCQIWCFFHNNT